MMNELDDFICDVQSDEFSDYFADYLYSLELERMRITTSKYDYDEYFHGDVNDEVVEAYEDYYSD